MPPLNSSHPVPARKPPTTGYGTNRTRLPSRAVPSTKKTTPQRVVTTSVAPMTVRKTSGVLKSCRAVAWATLAISAALAAVVAATTASTAAAASCTLPTTPRLPALHARIASDNVAATR